MKHQSETSEWSIYQRKSFDDFRVGVVYPSSYSVGMSNLGFHWVVRRIETTEGFYCERFLPGDGRRLDLRSLENDVHPQECHLLVASISFEMDYPGFLRFLIEAGIPPLSHERDSRYPLIIGGGAAFQVNPEPMAPFFDVILPGEGEAILAVFLDRYRAAADRENLMAEIATEPYVYIPSLSTIDYDSSGNIRSVKKQQPVAGENRNVLVQLPPLPAEKLHEETPPFNNILTNHTEFSNTLLVEIGRGCSKGCRYCWAGYRYLPQRSFSTASIQSLAEEARRGTKKIGLVSTAVFQHPQIEHLLQWLGAREWSIGVSSLRLDDITPQRLQLLVSCGLKTITLAPETGSDPLRRSINKSFDNEEILEKAALSFQCGLTGLKLYFMFGLPGETVDDWAATVSLITRICRTSTGPGSAKNRPPVTVSFSPFIPKPNTPFQYAQLADPVHLKQALRYFKRNLSGLKEVQMQFGSVKEAVMQHRLSMGTRQAGEYLLSLARGKINLQEFIRSSPYWQPGSETDESPPWSVLSWGLSENFLQKEWDKARKNVSSSPCPGGTRCHRCGICQE